MLAVLLTAVLYWAGLSLVVSVTSKTFQHCNAQDFGALGNGRVDDTHALQSAVDKCARVSVPAGTYRVAQLRLRGYNSHLFLRPGAVLVGSDDKAAYMGGQDQWYAVSFEDCSECSISGGELTGQAQAWVQRVIPGDRKIVRNWSDASCDVAKQCRPRLLGVRNSKHVRIRDVRLSDAIFWTTHILNSTDVHIKGANITGDWMIPNNDGIDIDSSSKVLVEDSWVDTADDAVCVKTTQPGVPVHDVEVRSSTLRSRSSAVKLGSESVADFYNIRIHDITIRPSHRALGIQLRDGGSMDDVHFRGITLQAQLDNTTWWGNGEAILVDAFKRRAEQPRQGKLHRVTFDGIRGECESGIELVGSNETLIGQVVLADVRLRMAQLQSEYPGGFRDLRPGPELQRGVPVAGLHAMHLHSLVMKNVHLTYPENSAWRPEWGEALQPVAATIGRQDLVGVQVRNEGIGVETLDLRPLKTSESRVRLRGQPLPHAPGMLSLLTFFGVLVVMGYVVYHSSGLPAALGWQRLPSGR